uniref:NADH-ubiquinone oxidoreductase chain 4L n=2 Tax=Biston TaxID=82594 RepID=K9M6M0_BISPA|nr:NADH dehydrogenase subunit 4L [Biston panterinaria]YP_009268477.1 NADH dehydrogenase subunit 4L [Biston thibetaria]AFQ99229.1 NADH dehydrogenase subunit 4L [Biston panterinaria]AID67372.1 NADH dehydrogenase subunit 4L [Biston thibetaria]AID67389.1 NADH dehydrogenase subunit 4L [Biston panterinaria]AIE11780.1 NADH dehydrogenase subunit 4L [Biston thibetaria]ANW36758.1 NADH dehydrogenase subunit 4L [Biston panterinaria]
MMMKYMYLIIIVMFIIGNLIFVSKYKHLLIVLLSLEFMVLSIYFFFLNYLLFLNYEIYMLMVFLVFSVCEGALGLSILVSLIRTHGNDYFKSFNLL